MTDTLSYIDDYFQQQLPDAERRIFETRCAEDTAFAGEVAFYITSRQALKDELLATKQTAWKEASKANKPVDAIVVSKKSPVTRWLAYAAAACIALLAVFFFFNKKESAQQLANDYIEKNCTQLSQTMDAGNDSLQLGIAAYNKKEYSTALFIFENIAQTHPEKTDAKKYAGYVSLVTRNYDKAIQQFDSLSGIKDLYSNPGLFLKAITLLQRNKAGDAVQAKEILQQIVKEDAGNKQFAEELLKKM